jgi:hypothetical protein
MQQIHGILNDDATIDDTEGINGTSLLLDGDLDFAQTNGTNSTTYINDMSIAAWVKPNYTKGSPEFTVVSKGKSFVLSINNILEPERIAKFAIFDGIKWTAVESYSTIPDSSWTHLTARFNKTAIELYVNGTLENSVRHNGIPYVSERGQIELKTLQEITSYYDILIGASLTPNMQSDAYNMFSGLIDGVALYDYRLGPEDVQKIYQETTPIKTPEPELEPRGIPKPALQYRILKTNDLPVSVNVDELNIEIDELTVSAWVTPNYTFGSPEFTVLSRENSFALALNKMISPEQMAKFSVYDGITWYTVIGSTPINGTAFVTAVFNRTNISLYVNGTLDGRLDTGPSSLVSSTSNVTIGAYENTLRSDAKQSNFFAGTLEDITIYQYAMVDEEIQEQYWEYLKVYQPPDRNKQTVALLDSIASLEQIGIPDATGIPIVLPESLIISDNVMLYLNGIPLVKLQDSLVFSDSLLLTLNNQTIVEPNNKTITFSESFSLLDSVIANITKANQTEIIPVNPTVLDDSLILTDSILIKLNDTTYAPLEEGLQFTESILFFLNGDQVLFDITNETSNLIHSTIEIGKIVNWTQTVMLNETEDVSNILVELPADAQNIEIQKIHENGTTTDIPEDELVVIEAELEFNQTNFDVPMMQELDLQEIAREHNVTKIVPLDYAKMEKLKEIKQKDKPTKALLVNETRSIANVTTTLNVPESVILPQNKTTQNQTEYMVKFQTSAPYTIEHEIPSDDKYLKNITVAHNSTLHYTNVKSYSDIPEDLVELGVEFKLNWYINGTKEDVTDDPRFQVDLVDTDGNDIEDRMEWIVPQLSEQEFEIEADIEIINVQSYPVVGGNWTVQFDTIGTADLTITGINGTTFGTALPDDLEFLELNNGTHTLSPIVNLTANTITYYNYSSNFTGFETSKVLTPGSHHLMFQFGNDIAFAHNFARLDNSEIATGRFSITGGTGDQVITGIGFQPKAYILFLMANNADDTPSTNGGAAKGSRMSIGMVDNSGNEFCTSSGEEDDISGNGDVGRRMSTSAVLCNFDVQLSQVDLGQASHVSMDSDGFTINKGTAFTDPTTPIVHYIAFGGNIQTTVDIVDLANSVGSSWDETNPGFEPDLVLTSYVGNHDDSDAASSNDDNSLSFGWAINPSIQAANNQYSVMMASRESGGGTHSFTEMSNQYAGLSHKDGARDTAYEINTFDSQGFSVTTRTAAATDGGGGDTPTEEMGYLAIDFGNNPEIYSTTRTARLDTNDDVVTGAGFQPTFLLGIGGAEATAFNTEYSGGSLAVGFTNGTHTYAFSGWVDDITGNTDTASRLTNTQFWSANLDGPTETIEYEATFDSFDPDGWTIDYNDASGSAFQQAYLAIRAVPTNGDLVQPNSAASGMKIAVQVVGNEYSDTDVVTTNSSDIVVGPIIVTNEAGDEVATGGKVLTTMLFINETATPGPVEIRINGNPATYTFTIIDRDDNFIGTGNYTGLSGTYTLGDNTGINGNRTLAGTIVLDELIVPPLVTLLIDVSDIDPDLQGNQGFLPGVLVVDGIVDIQGTIDISGQAGEDGETDGNEFGGDGGDGGPGGGGGGGGGADDNQGGDGGDGFTGGAGGGADECGGSAGDGGDGTGGVGSTASSCSPNIGGNGGSAIAGNGTGGTGGTSDSSDGGGGGGGTGFIFGSGGFGGDDGGGGDEAGAPGNGGSGGGDQDDDNEAAGAGFGEAGQSTPNAVGGYKHGNDQLSPIAGGSGGGGGGNTGSGGSGAGGGGGGAILIYGNNLFTVDGDIFARGGDGGLNGNGCGTDGEGGGGSGGGIILQSRLVDITGGAGTISAIGGNGQDCGSGPGSGDGGDGRVRIDGVPAGSDTIVGLDAGFGGTEFVGPAITSINPSLVIGTATALATVNATIQTPDFGTAEYEGTADANGDFAIAVSFLSKTNFITVIQNTTDTNSVMSSASGHLLYRVSIVDSVSADDDIIKIGIIMKPDGIGVSDDISFKAFIALVDGTRLESITVRDTTFALTKILLTDEVAADDDIWKIGMKMSDSLEIQDQIFAKAKIALVDGTRMESVTVMDTTFALTEKFIADSATIDDEIFVTIIKYLFDDITADDKISSKAKIALTDGTRLESITVMDTVFALTEKSIEDSATIDDEISAKLLKTLEDSVSIDDSITVRVFIQLSDSVSVEDYLRTSTIGVKIFDSVTADDFISAKSMIFLSDDITIFDRAVKKVPLEISSNVQIDDTIFVLTRKTIEDSATIDDTIFTLTRKTILDSIDVSDQLSSTAKIALVDGTRMESLTVLDTVFAQTEKFIEDSGTIDDKIFALTRKTLQDSITIVDLIFTKQFILLYDEISADDLIFTKLSILLTDEIEISEEGIAVRIRLRSMEDGITIDDMITKKIPLETSSNIAIDDTIFALTRKLLQDNIIIDDKVTKIIHVNSMSDGITMDDVIFTNRFTLLPDEITIDDTIFALTRKTLQDSILVEDLLHSKTLVSLFDDIIIDDMITKKIPLEISSNIAIDDTIFALTRKPLQDSILVEDQLIFKTLVSLFDGIIIDDMITKKIPKKIFSNVTIDDTIFALTRKTLQDSIIIDDVIVKKRIFLSIFDEATIDDEIFITIGKKLFDDIATDDLISPKTKIIMLDELDIADGDPIIAVHIQSAKDAIGIDDFIKLTLLKSMLDGISADDMISSKAKMRIFDEVTVDDAFVQKKAFLSIFDEATIDDEIFVTIGKKIFDSIATDDLLSSKARMRMFDEVTVLPDAIIAVHIQSIKEEATIDDEIFVTIGKKIFDSIATDDLLSSKAKMTMFDEVAVNDAIGKKTFLSIFDEATIDDEIFVTIGKKIFDSIATDDLLSSKAKIRIFDDVSIDDEVIKVVRLKAIYDSAEIDDEIFVTIIKYLFDDITTDDKISFKAKMTTFDEVIVDDAISKKTFLSIFDEATIDDEIFVTIGKKIFDGITTDDKISFKARIALIDGTRLESITVLDSVSTKPSLVISDQTTVDDTITTRIMYGRNIQDDIAVDDVFSKKAFYLMSDSITTDDAISSKAFFARMMQDSVTVDDTITTIASFGRIIEDNLVSDATQRISIKYRGAIFENIIADDSMQVAGLINIETRDPDGDLVFGLATQYRILPNPLNGNSSLLVLDGGPNDYDGIANNGQISVFAPLGTYRVNQTTLAFPLLGIMNFTYVTVHPNDMNATALFRVFDLFDDPEDVAQTNSDKLDIADYGFDNLLASVQLVNVTNGTQIIINKTSEMPYPIFVGVDKPIQINNAADSQATLLYRNLVGLTSNNTPDEIISAFRQTEYDAGNYTEISFIGVLSATEQSSSSQYLATEPFDKFNCGQQYLYGIDDTLVPNGGITGFNFTLDVTGTCPGVQDYLTHEIATVPPAGSGTPGLPDEDILLYINPQNPATGVDFSNATNIDSFNYTIITSLGATANVNDLTVYLLNGGSWSTAGVTELSKQLISTGPNAGKVEIQVSVDYLSKIVVGGKRIPVPPIPDTPPLSGFGRTLVGPSSGPGGGPDEGVAKIHRIEYDVCNENISRILVGHANSNPPLLQILATKSGVIDATLAADQPYLVQNEFTLIDRYLFEAPLAPGENIFTIFAVDYRSNVDRVLVEVDGCEGVIIIVDDQVILPTIFDVKYQIDNSTYKPDISYSYIEAGEEIEVSAIVQSPIVPLLKAELFVSTLGDAEQTILPMDITELELPELDDLYVTSSIIPEDLIQGPAVEYWIRVVTEDGIVKESEHSIVGVKPEDYSDTSSAEMDTVTIKAQGTRIKPTTYLTNEGEIPVYGTVSLLVDGDTVYSKPALFTPGQNRISLEWGIPKSDTSVTYDMQAALEVYDKRYITSDATLNTFVRTQIVPIEQQTDIVSILDENGNTIARPAMMYSSNEGSGQFRVTAPDGTCVIGAGCIVQQSTLLHRGGIDSVILDGQIYRVRYSGADSPLERFSITSLDSVLGQWTVEIKLDESMIPSAAAEDNSIKVQYRAERSPLITVRSE